MSGKRTAPSDEEMAPPVYEEGSNIGPNISLALDCEHLDADLFRSNQVSITFVSDLGIVTHMSLDGMLSNCGSQLEREVSLVVKS